LSKGWQFEISNLRSHKAASNRGLFAFWPHGMLQVAKMPVDPIFGRVFRKLYGKPCWGVKNTVGTALTFEFGKPHLEIREPKKAGPNASRRVREILASRRVFVHGDWHLCIWLCSWEIFQSGRRLGSQRARANMGRIISSLDGQKLVRFSMAGSGRRCRFDFDLGGALMTSRSEPGHDHWYLYDPTHHVLTLRGDGKYSYQSSNQPCDAGPWMPVILLENEKRREK
jgi:hypothetical protein